MLSFAQFILEAITTKRPCKGPNCGCTTNHIVTSHPETGESMWQCTNCDHLSPKTTRTSKKKKELDDLFDKLVNEERRTMYPEWGIIHPATGEMIDGNKVPGVRVHHDLKVHLSKKDKSVPVRAWHKAPEYAHVPDTEGSNGYIITQATSLSNTSPTTIETTSSKTIPNCLITLLAKSMSMTNMAQQRRCSVTCDQPTLTSLRTSSKIEAHYIINFLYNIFSFNMLDQISLSYFVVDA